MVSVDPLLLRFLERLVSVVIGGLTIYLGYRLFLSLPDYRDAAGKFVLPLNTSVVVSRVGPGVFFALFGIVAVSISLFQPLEIDRENGRVHYAGNASTNGGDAKADGRALLRREIAILNTVPKHLNPNLSNSDRKDLEEGVRRVKLALMKPVWGEARDGFGDFSKFEEWAMAEEKSPPPAMDEALLLYRYGGSQ
jgi:hypothetical protein